MSNAQKRSQSNPEKYSKPWKKVELKDVFYVSLFGLTLTLGIIFGIRTILIIQSKNPQQPTSSCGKSVEEARLLGCKYDIMMGAWLPQECYDRQFSQDNIVHEQSRWFWDKNLTTSIPMERLRQGDFSSAFTHPEFHLRHCVYMFMKLVRAYEEGFVMVDSDSMQVAHRAHCAKVLRDPYGHDLGAPGLMSYSRVDVSFMHCEKVVLR